MTIPRELLPELDGAEPGALESERIPGLRSVVRLGEARMAGMFNYAEVATGDGEPPLLTRLRHLSRWAKEKR